LTSEAEVASLDGFPDAVFDIEELERRMWRDRLRLKRIKDTISTRADSPTAQGPGGAGEDGEEEGEEEGRGGGRGGGGGGGRGGRGGRGE